jgi:hypothetical protein
VVGTAALTGTTDRHLHDDRTLAGIGMADILSHRSHDLTLSIQFTSFTLLTLLALPRLPHCPSGVAC